MKKQILLDKLLELQAENARILTIKERYNNYLKNLFAKYQELLSDNDKLREERAYWERKYFAISEELNRNKPEETQDDKDKEEKEA